MKKIYIVLLLFCFSFLPVAAITNTESSHIVMEATTNRVLTGTNLNKQFLVASTAKILTAITAIENYNLTEEIIITKADTLEVGSKVYLKENEKITRRDLLYALMLRSANDAASALSSNNSTQFIRLMNTTAKKIGMKNSVFVNASGLDEKEYNLSTAYDMALLASYAAKNDVFVQIASAHQYSCKTKESNYSWANKHKLVTSDESFVFGKTGYTKKSKRILVSNYQKENKNLIIVTINDGNDWNHHRALASENDNYSFITIFKKGIYNTKQDVPYYLHVKEDIVIPVKKKEKEEVNIIFKLYKTYAKLEVFLNQKMVLEKCIDVYDKKTLDMDLVIDIFN
ncbi:MAG: serine hydrolase [Anaeroplasmataceae bacterium]|nr:serine hydrolase [Anaeroplasmataceae bacterium]